MAMNKINSFIVSRKAINTESPGHCKTSQSYLVFKGIIQSISQTLVTLYVKKTFSEHLSSKNHFKEALERKKICLHFKEHGVRYLIASTNLNLKEI